MILTAPGDSFRKDRQRPIGQRTKKAMRDLIFMLAPVGLIVYFVVYPDQFNAFLYWAGQYLH